MPADPSACPHKFVHQGERWHGQGKYVYWQCKDCDAYLRPFWVITDVFGKPLEGGAKPVDKPVDT